MGMSEKQLERKCCRMVEARGWLAIKMVSPNRVGVPDRMFVAPGTKVFFIEFKTPAGSLSGPQARTVTVFGGLGHYITIIRSVEQFERWMKLHI